MGPRSHVSSWLIYLLAPLHAAIMAVYFRARLRHADRLPRSGPVILAPTHRSRWDTLMIYHATGPRPLRFLTSDNEIAGVQGWFIRRLGAFPINPRRPTPGALKHCREILLSGQPLVIFPEGNIFRIPPGWVHPLKPGAAWLAIGVQRELGDVPLKIVPIRLEFSDRFLRFRSRAEVVVGEPIVVSSYFDRSDKEAIRAITADLQRALGERVDERPAEVVNARGELPPPPAPDGPEAAEPAAASRRG